MITRKSISFKVTNESVPNKSRRRGFFSRPDVGVERIPPTESSTVGGGVGGLVAGVFWFRRISVVVGVAADQTANIPDMVDVPDSCAFLSGERVLASLARRVVCPMICTSRMILSLLFDVVVASLAAFLSLPEEGGRRERKR